MHADPFSPAPDVAAFTSLRAEDEPWLARAFVFPRDYPLMAGRSSVIIYSEPGGGRSAVLTIMKQEASEGLERTMPLWIPVWWEPDPPELWDEREVQEVWRRDVLAHCSLGILEYVALHTDTWRQMPGWGQAFLEAFIRAFPPPMHEYEIERLREEAPAEGKAWLSQLTSSPSASGASLQAVLQRQPVAQLIKRLISTLKRAGIEGVWVLMDGFERWEANIDLERPRVKRSLERFFSTLTFFDHPGFVFKMAAPQSWRRFLSRTHAVSTRRIQEFELRWADEELMSMVGRRLALASGGRLHSLGDICEAPEAARWLQRYGGGNPRRWLAWTGDLYRAYLEAGGNAPLPAERWASLRFRLAPRLRVTPDRRVLVGSMEVTGLSESLYRVLAYLYEHSGEVCSRRALYQAYRPDEELPYNWESVMETVIWRLRQAIEPDPRHPIFLITERGRGVRLLRTR